VGFSPPLQPYCKQAPPFKKKAEPARREEKNVYFLRYLRDIGSAPEGMASPLKHL
jgi:hypothetical protein